LGGTRCLLYQSINSEKRQKVIIADKFMTDISLIDQVKDGGNVKRLVPVIEYKGYYGAIEIDIDTNELFGRVLYIDDVITFKAKTVKQAKIEFAKSVEDYLKFCKELNKEPN
jgi:hypothetical protein